MSQAQSGETANVCQQPQKTSQYLISQLLGIFFFFAYFNKKFYCTVCKYSAMCIYFLYTDTDFNVRPSVLVEHKVFTLETWYKINIFLESWLLTHSQQDLLVP